MTKMKNISSVNTKKRVKMGRILNYWELLNNDSKYPTGYTGIHVKRVGAFEHTVLPFQ